MVRSPPAPPRKQRELSAADLMLATPCPKPFNRTGWVFEMKYDGFRVLAIKQGKLITLPYGKPAACGACPYPAAIEGQTRILRPAPCSKRELPPYADASASAIADVRIEVHPDHSVLRVRHPMRYWVDPAY